MYANQTVAIAESFLINELSKHIKVPESASAAIAGIFNVSTSGFNNTDVYFNGRATDSYDSLSAVFISTASPFYGQLQQYALQIGKDIGSVTTQIGFLKDVLGIDFEEMTGGTIADVISYVNKIYDKFAKPNYMYDEVTKVYTATSVGLIPVEEQIPAEVGQQVLQNAFNALSIEISPTALTAPLTVNEYNWDVGRDPTFSGIVRENQILTFSSGTGGSNQQQAKATIEDAIASLTGYFIKPLNSYVAQAEELIDAELGTNSRQYAYVNRKKTGSTSSSGASGGQSTSNYEYEPASISNRSQYIDRIVKRYIFNVAETMLKEANAAMKYHLGE